MKVLGINPIAVLVAGIAFYAVGFLIYGVLIPADIYRAMSGISEAEMAAVGQSRMAFGVLMPLSTALFLAILFKMGGVDIPASGISWAIVVALASAVPATFYGWVYETGSIEMTLTDSGHLLLGHTIAGAILGAWGTKASNT